MKKLIRWLVHTYLVIIHPAPKWSKEEEVNIGYWCENDMLIALRWLHDHGIEGRTEVTDFVDDEDSLEKTLYRVSFMTPPWSNRKINNFLNSMNTFVQESEKGE